MYSRKRNDVTYIEDLPSLEDLENRPPQSANIPEKFQKFIRPPHSPPPQAGMAPEKFEMPPPMMKEQPTQQYAQEYDKLLENTPSCLQVADHVSACPICSKFYNNDRSLYIIAIVILAVLCIILLKKVLDL